MKLMLALMSVLLLVGLGVLAYLLSQSSASLLPLLALIVIFALTLLSPLRRRFLPETTFTPSTSLVRVLVGGGILLFVLIASVLFVLLVVGSSVPY